MLKKQWDENIINTIKTNTKTNLLCIGNMNLHPSNVIIFKYWLQKHYRKKRYNINMPFFNILAMRNLTSEIHIENLMIDDMNPHTFFPAV